MTTLPKTNMAMKHPLFNYIPFYHVSFQGTSSTSMAKSVERGHVGVLYDRRKNKTKST